MISYKVEKDVVFFTITDKSHPRVLSFNFLDDVATEFDMSYGAQVESQVKPYAFSKFGMSPQPLCLCALWPV